MISAVVLTKNEEQTIGECMKALAWCDETLVVDDYSADATAKIAEKLGARVLKHSLDNNFSQQRNFGLEHAKYEWVIFVDADEIVSRELALEIKLIINSDSIGINHQSSIVIGYYIKRLDTMWGKILRHGETGNIKLLRLAKKTAGKWVGKVHETWIVNGPTGYLENFLNHYPHPTIDEFLSEINRYTDIRSQELYEKGIRTNFWQIAFYPRIKFDQNYFLKFGFLDGIPGLLVAILMSFHSFLVRGKLWQLSSRTHEIRTSET